MGIYQKTNLFLSECFHELEAPAVTPEPTNLGVHIVLRYKVHCLEIAIIQKLARYISGLNASWLLLESGYTQELGAIFRTLDEFHEDILFLALPLVSEVELTETHKKYLDEFFQEELDNPDNPLQSTQKRGPIPRKKIRSIIANSDLGGLNPHDSQELSRTLSQAYSGYVHGASGHICEMVGGKPLKYFLSGMAGTPRQNEFLFNYWDYAYRGLLATVFSAKALGDGDVAKKCTQYIEYFEKTTGDSGRGDPEKLVKKMKRKNA
jgi:hypothetical protein